MLATKTQSIAEELIQLAPDYGWDFTEEAIMLITAHEQDEDIEYFLDKGFYKWEEHPSDFLASVLLAHSNQSDEPVNLVDLLNGLDVSHIILIPSAGTFLIKTAD